MYPLTVGLTMNSREMSNEVHECLRHLQVEVLMDQPRIDDWDSFLSQIERLRPDVMVLDLANCSESLEETVRRIKRTSVSPGVVAVHHAADPDIILRAMRAGAAEYLYSPLHPGLCGALERMASEKMQRRDDGRPRAKTLAFFSAKGGCGATSLACHTAVEIQQQTGKEVLLVDLDLESGMVGFLMRAQAHYSVLDALKNSSRLDLSFWKALVSQSQPGLEILSAPEAVSYRQITDPDRLRSILRFVRAHYDWVVADLGRGLGLQNMNLIEEVDEAFLVTTPDVPSLFQAKHIVRALVGNGYSQERLRVLLNRVPKSSDITIAEVREMLGIPVLAVLPDEYAALTDSYADGKLLPAHSHLGKQLNAVARKIAGVPQEKIAKKRFGIF